MPDQKISLVKTGAASPLMTALSGCAALAVAMGIGRFAFTPVLPMMLQDTGLTIASGGWLASANYLGYLIGALSAVVLRIAPQRAIRAGLLTVGLTTVAMAAPLPFVAWLLLRLGAGIASAWVLISISAWSLEALSVYRRPLLNSLVFAGVGVGIMSAGLLCILLTRSHAGSAAAWMTLGALALAVSALLWPCFAPLSPAAVSQPPAGPAGAPRRRTVDAIRLIACYGVFGYGYIIPATFLPVMAKHALHDAPAFGWAWPLFGLAAVGSTLTVSRLARRWPNRRIWSACHGVMAAGCLLPVLSPRLPAIFAAALCVGGTFMVITLVALQEAKQFAGRDATGLIAAMSAAFAGGQIIGPLTVGAGGSAGFSGGLSLAAVLLASSAVLLHRPFQPAAA